MGDGMDEAAKNDVVLTRDAILGAIGDSALQIMRITIEEAQLVEVEGGLSVDYDHWVSSTFLDMSKAQILMRVHFKTVDSRYFTTMFFGGKSGHRPQTTHDQVKEFSNMVMGRVKTAISSESNSQELVQVYLPKVEAGFDNFEKAVISSESTVQEKSWKLILDEDRTLLIFAKVKGEVAFTRELIDRLTSNVGVAVDDEGDIDYF
jgi:hypothetical protein